MKNTETQIAVDSSTSNCETPISADSSTSNCETPIKVIQSLLYCYVSLAIFIILVCLLFQSAPIHIKIVALAVSVIIGIAIGFIASVLVPEWIGRCKRNNNNP